jgi:ClpP class serine protease
LFSIGIELMTLKSQGHGIGISEEEFMRRVASGDYNALHRADPFHREMLAFGPSEPLEGANYTRIYEGGVGVVDVTGAIYRHASNAPSGAVSTGRLARDIMVMRKSDKVRSAVIVEDTPGGEATGGDELADKIAEFAAEKPIETYIEGLGASLGYMIAAPTQKITASRMALVGSIGVVIGVPIPKGQLPTGEMVHQDAKGNEYVEFVSSVSPLKRVNPLSKKGHEHYLNIVNRAADVFVGLVAQYRGIAAEDVPKQYGDGGIYPTQDALEMGLIDAVGSFESVHQRLASSFYKSTGETVQGTSVEDKGKPDTDTDVPTTKANPESLDAGDNEGGIMGRLDEILARLNLGGSSDKPKVKGAATQGEGQGTNQGQPTTMSEWLEQCQTRRPALERQFQPSAILEATTLVTDSRIDPVIQVDVTFEFLNAMVDDTLYGGTVLFAEENAEGELEEIQGTRLEMVQSKYARTPRHSMAESRVRSVKTGRADNPQALAPSRPSTQGKTYQEAGDNGVEVMSDDELLATSPGGQSAIANRNNGNGSKATTR